MAETLSHFKETLEMNQILQGFWKALEYGGINYLWK